MLALLLTPAVTRAQADAVSAGDSSPDETYKLHMRNGVKLFQDRNYGAAIVEFQAAYDAVPKASPLVNIALCHKASFKYPKAISSLELALAQHRDSMDESDIKAAEAAVTEMRALLAYVTVKLTPREAKLFVDEEALPPFAADAPVALGPGTHKLSATAPGYADGAQTVTVASGQNDVVVELRLIADQGYVHVEASDAQTAIAVDGRPMGYGSWAGLLPPGAHVIQMYVPDGATESRQVLVVAGKTIEVGPGKGGVTVQAAQPTTPGRKAPPEAAPSEPKRGIFALATGSLLGPAQHPVGFPDPKQNTGAAVGLRAGYRVSNMAAFDLGFEYGNATLRSNKSDDLEYSITSLRIGLDLRLMTTGDTVRFVGSLGGGAVQSTLAFSLTESVLTACINGDYGECDDKLLRSCTDESGCTGLDPYFALEAGIELDFDGVLLGAAIGGNVQSTKGIDPGSPYDNNPVGFFGGGLRVGFGAW